MNSIDFSKSVREGNVDLVSHTSKVIEECERINSEYNYFNVISKEVAIESAKKLNQKKEGRLCGVAVSIKDCICVKDVESRAGSKILNGYKPLFDATVVEKLKKEGAIVIGKTSQDEFGFGGFSTNVGIGFKVPKNPFDKERVTGGSSGGCGGITQKASFAHISIGESTGGSIVNPAAFCGVYGLCPTYGRVSRYGLIDYGNSLDKIGPMAKSIEEIAVALEIIAGYDHRDSTSANVPVPEYSKSILKEIKGIKIGVVKETFGEGVNQEIVNVIKKKVSELASCGAEVIEVSLPITMKYGIPAYYLIAMSEASTNLSKFCGIRYGASLPLEGSFNEYFSKVREANFGKEAKRRVIIGTFARMAGFRDAYYIKAMKVRAKIIEEYKEVFSKVDVIITPTVPILPPRFSEISNLSLIEQYMIDIMTVGPNLAGLPHLNVPVGFSNGLPIGMLIIGNHFDEEKIIRVGAKV